MSTLASHKKSIEGNSQNKSRGCSEIVRQLKLRDRGLIVIDFLIWRRKNNISVERKLKNA